MTWGPTPVNRFVASGMHQAEALPADTSAKQACRRRGKQAKWKPANIARPGKMSSVASMTRPTPAHPRPKRRRQAFHPKARDFELESFSNFAAYRRRALQTRKQSSNAAKLLMPALEMRLPKSLPTISPLPAYLAVSMKRLSRTTVTLISPG